MDCYSAGALLQLAAKFQDSRQKYLYEQIVLSLFAPLKRAHAKRDRASKAA